MLSLEEESPFKFDVRRHEHLSGQLAPANLYPLVGLMSLLGGTDELKADLVKLGPLEGSELSAENMLKDQASRELRAAAGERVREILLQAVASPIIAESDNGSPEEDLGFGNALPNVGSLAGPGRFGSVCG